MAIEQHQVKVTGTGSSPNGKSFLVVEPWFQTKYPLNIYLKEGVGGGIQKGDVVVVEKGALMKDRNGQLKDEKFPSSFYWNLIEGAYLVTGDQRPAGPAPAKQASAPQQSAQQDKPKPDPTREAFPDTKQFRTAIEMTRRDALEFAVHWWKGELAAEDYGRVLDTAADFAEWLETGKGIDLQRDDDHEQLPF